jgi:hypothetical protein
MEEPIPQIIVTAILFLMCVVIYRKSMIKEDLQEPEMNDKETDGSFTWTYKNGGANLYKMIELTHESGLGLRAEIENGLVSMFTLSGNEVSGFDYQAPQFNYRFLRERMKRYLVGRLPKPKQEPTPIRTIEEHKIRSYKALTKDDKLEIVGGKLKRRYPINE